jgi:hypothetical protein
MARCSFVLLKLKGLLAVRDATSVSPHGTISGKLQCPQAFSMLGSRHNNVPDFTNADVEDEAEFVPTSADTMRSMRCQEVTLVNVQHTEICVARDLLQSFDVLAIREVLSAEDDCLETCVPRVVVCMQLAVTKSFKSAQLRYVIPFLM